MIWLKMSRRSLDPVTVELGERVEIGERSFASLSSLEPFWKWSLPAGFKTVLTP